MREFPFDSVQFMIWKINVYLTGRDRRVKRSGKRVA